MSPPLLNSRPQRFQLLRNLRTEHLVIGTLFLVIFLSQIWVPLGQYNENTIDVNLRTPAVLLRGPSSSSSSSSPEELERRRKQHIIQEYVDANQEQQQQLEDADPDDSHDSHDAPFQELSSGAIKLMEVYQWQHSQHTMAEQEDECHERTNRNSEDTLEDVLDGDWCPAIFERKFMVVDWIDPCGDEANNKNNDNEHHHEGRHDGEETGIQLVQDLVRGIAWAMVTGRTVLFREVGLGNEQVVGKAEEPNETSCDGDECAKRYDMTDCKGMAKLDPWVPLYAYWKREHGWDESIVQTVSIGDLDHNDSPKVVRLGNPPSLSIGVLSTAKTVAIADELLDFDMAYGMLLDETILFKEPEIESVDTSDEDAIRTRRYAVQAKAARTSECPLQYEQPCVIYQIGTDAIGPSACNVVQTTKEKDLSSFKAILQIFALAGNAIDGVVLSEDLEVRDLLIEFLKYRGRLEDRDFRLQGCWGEEEASSEDEDWGI